MPKNDQDTTKMTVEVHFSLNKPPVVERPSDASTRRCSRYVLLKNVFLTPFDPCFPECDKRMRGKWQFPCLVAQVSKDFLRGLPHSECFCKVFIDISSIVSQGLVKIMLRSASLLRRMRSVAPATTSSSVRAAMSSVPDVFAPTDVFIHRHNGPQGKEKQAMLEKIGFNTMDELTKSTVPENIRLAKPLSLEQPMSESTALATLKKIMSKNIVNKSFIGVGYYETLCPGVILRNVLENPGWYTAYTPYQAEIAQGRLQSLLNFQTMVTDLTGMALSNASLLDEVHK